MKIIVIGATGTIGKAIVEELSPRHDIIQAGFSRGDIQVDITNNSSIAAMYQNVQNIDAIVIATGKVLFAELEEMDSEKYHIGIESKLMGQVNVVQLGLNHINEGGSFTLTSGILNHDPIRSGISASMVNGAIDGFVKGAAIEMPRRVRINCVSPTVILESMPDYGPFFRGYQPAPAATAALAYSKSVEGLQTGQIYRVGY